MTRVCVRFCILQFPILDIDKSRCEVDLSFIKFTNHLTCCEGSKKHLHFHSVILQNDGMTRKTKSVMCF